MKPNFALNFTDDGISLLHRTKRGWAEIGSTPFDVPDLPAVLAVLRDKAVALSPAGITTKLVIPNSQIKYLTLDAPGPDAAKRRAQIAAGLEGQTPYDVTDLVWDHSGKGPSVQVAVLARETLEEAEGFATANGFNPVSFVAIPAKADWAGEPFFGMSSHAETILKSGEKVTRDQDPILILAAQPAEPDVVPEPDAPEVEPDPEPQPETTPLPDTEPVQIPPSEPETVPEPEPAEAPDPGDDPQPEPEPVNIPQPDPTPDSDPVELPQDLPGFDPSPEPVTMDRGPDPAFDPASIAATLNAPDPDLLSEPVRTSVLSPVLSDADEAPMAVDVDEPADAPRKGNVLIDPSVEDDLPPMPSSVALAAFNSRARAEAPASPRPAAPRIVAPSAERPAPKAERPARTPKFGYETPGERPAPPAGKGIKGLGAFVTATTIPGSKKARAMGGPVQAPAQPAVESATAPAQPARRPAGLGSRPMPVRGKPRHLGLILTGLLLIMLALAAGLSSFYVTWNDQPTEVQTADLPAPEDEMAADGILPEDIASDTTGQAEATATDEALAEQADAATPVQGVVMEAQDPAAAQAAAQPPAASPAEPAPQGIATATPDATATPGADPRDEIFLAASDTAPEVVDATALPRPVARSEAQPQAPPPPPPFGTVYQFDANGLIVPTPEGIVSPEGVLLTAGRPKLVPPPRPEAIAATAAASAPAGPEPAVEATIPADPALAGARPRPRPADLVPVITPPADDDASLAPLADPRLAGIRPAARPESVTAAAVAAGAVAPVTAGNNGSLALVTPEGATSPVGLTISRRPAARPQDMARAIEEAVAAVNRLPEPPVVEEVAPEAEPEPEPVASAAPRIPSSANVAKQATIANAINLREINLIGVYGTQSDRYALVRTANGRYTKVGVGDRLDGGRVAAITASELRYEKRGRMVVLSLPQG